VCVCVFFYMLRYKIILHVPVLLTLCYVLLYNKTVPKMSLLIPQDSGFPSGRVQGLSSSVFESL
jgi:hypothetical protein